MGPTMQNSEKVPVAISAIFTEEEHIFTEKIRRRSSVQIAKEKTIGSSFNDNLQQYEHKHSNCEQKGDNRKYSKHKITNEKPKGNDKSTEKRPNEDIDPDVPKDKFNIVWIMCFILGLVHILPYSFFIRANEYWMYKFRNVTSNSTDANDRTYLQANFSSLSHLISLVPSVATQFLLIFLGHKIKAKTRIMWSISIQLVVFLLQTAFVNINTDDWQELFFVITALSLAFISCSMCLCSTGNVTTVSQFPDPYLKIYLVGEGGAALFTAIMRLVSIIAAPTTTTAALLYFVTGSCIMTLSMIMLYLSTHLRFFRYYTKSMKESTKKRIPRLADFREVLMYSRLVIIGLVLLAVVPHSVLENLVVSEYYGTDSVWGNKYFVTCTTYLLTAICGIIGRTVFNKFEITTSQFILILLIIAYQLIFSPLLFFVNAKPRKHLPVLFPHDWNYALINGLRFFSAGYLSNMATFKSVRVVPPEKFELFWLVYVFIIKILEVAASPLGLLFVSLL